MEIKLHIIRKQPRNLQEAPAHTTEVNTVQEAENKKTTQRRGDVKVVRSAEEDPLSEVGKLKGE